MLGHFKSGKEEIDQIIKKKDKVEDLLGDEIAINSGMIIWGTKIVFQTTLSGWRNEVLCRELELIKQEKEK